MSRIAYVNGRYLPRAQADGLDRGPRLSVRRRRLRSLRGAGRAPGRRAPPHGAARPLARRTAHRAADVAGRARASCCAKPCGATACATASSICRSPAASRGAIFRFRRPARSRRVVVTARSNRSRHGSSKRRPRASPSSPCPTSAGSASTSSRSRCCPTCWPSRRRASRARARPGSSTRKAASPKAPRRMPGSSAATASSITRPLGHDILPGITRSVVLDVIKAQGLALRGARLHGRGGLCRARSLHHLGEPDRACRWCASTAGRSAMARPGSIATALAARLPPPRRIRLKSVTLNVNSLGRLRHANLCLRPRRACHLIAAS